MLGRRPVVLKFLRPGHAPNGFGGRVFTLQLEDATFFDLVPATVPILKAVTSAD
jgi:hypothetical protein